MVLKRTSLMKTKILMLTLVQLLDTKNAGSTATKQSNAVVSTQAQTRMEKFHGSNAKTLPNTGSDQQNGLAVAGAALLAGDFRHLPGATRSQT